VYGLFCSAILENDQMLKSMDNVALVMVLAHEVLRGEKSPWRPYIQLLPSRFTTPLFYSLEQLQQLKVHKSRTRSIELYLLAISLLPRGVDDLQAKFLIREC